MKILHVISTLSPRYGGPTTVLRSLSAAQVRRGHEVTICTTNLDYPDGILDVPTDRAVTENGVVVWYHRLDFRPMHVSWALARWLLQHITEYDVVHVHGLYRFPTTFAAAVARRRRVPYLICPHGSLDPFLYRRSRYSLPLKRLYERLFDLPNLNHAGAIQYTSDAEAERAAFLGLRAPWVVVPDGIAWTDFAEPPKPGGFRQRTGINAEEPLILFLGRLNFKKGLDLLVPAFAAVVRSCLAPALRSWARTMRDSARKCGSGAPTMASRSMCGSSTISHPTRRARLTSTRTCSRSRHTPRTPE